MLPRSSFNDSFDILKRAPKTTTEFSHTHAFQSQTPNFNNLLAVQFLLVLVKLFNHVHGIMHFGSRAKVTWIATSLCVDTRVQHQRPARYITTVVDNPGHFVRLQVNVLPFNPESQLPITIGEASFPQPAVVWSKNPHVRPESGNEIRGQELRQDVGVDRFGLHKSALLICATLSGVLTTAGAFLI